MAGLRLRWSHVRDLGIKELRSLLQERFLLVLILIAFTVSVLAGTRASPETLRNTPIAIVDEDRSPLSRRISEAFLPPYFQAPALVEPAEMARRLELGRDTFGLDLPPQFERDVLAGREPALQLNVDATRIGQAYSGSAYVQAIVQRQVQAFLSRDRQPLPPEPVELISRARFNPELSKVWFGSIMQVINQVTMLSLILSGAALVRERDRGTLEHLLAMPVTPLEIMLAKAWSMGLVVLVAAAGSLVVIVQGVLQVPIAGSLPLFLLGTAVHLFATTSMGMLIATLSRSMPQFGLLLLMVLLPLQMLSGSITPRESMPVWVQLMMLLAPNTHYVILSQGILYRGTGLAILWPEFMILLVIGALFLALALVRFRRSIDAIH
jgi:ABC-2 type transport system permease protein